MLDLVFNVLGFLLLTLLIAALVTAALAAAGVVAAGRLFERVFDLLVPSRDTGMGSEGLIGKSAIVVADFEPNGTDLPAVGAVRIGGERWRARCSTGAPKKGQQVRIDRVEGLLLSVSAVEPVEPTV
jgi:membrane protein implicated in regulation of membrane protease activity